MKVKTRRNLRTHQVVVFSILLVCATQRFWGERNYSQGELSLGLEQLLPIKAGEWWFSEITSNVPTVSNQFINEFHQGYFEDGKGRKVMVALEFGSDFRRRYQIHFPDDCHRARGDRVEVLQPETFRVKGDQSLTANLVDWDFERQGVRALCAYWIVVNGNVVEDMFELKLKQFFAGIVNEPQGVVLVRLDYFFVSDDVLTERERGLEIIRDFLPALFENLSPKARSSFLGL